MSPEKITKILKLKLIASQWIPGPEHFEFSMFYLNIVLVVLQKCFLVSFSREI